MSYNIAVLGATGAVGHEMLTILEERNFPINNIFALASKRSVGKEVSFGDQVLKVQDVDKFDFSEVDIALFSAGSSVSEVWAPIAGEKGCIVIYNTSFFRMDPEVPLVVPEVNPEALEEYTRKYPYLQQLKDDGVDWTLSNHYTIQAYNQGEGYFKLHCEKQLLLPDRILAWMVYLNDAESGTEFPYQGVTLTPKAGDLWIWPAYWTHAHKGVVPNQGFKCILTGWCVVKVTVPFSK